MQGLVVPVEGRTVGADLFVVIAHVDIDMRMIERHRGTRAHEFLDADLDHRVAAIVLKVGNTVPGHVMLRHVEE